MSRPAAEPCERCGKAKQWHGSITTHLEGQPVDLEQHMYLCDCYWPWPPITILERRNGGEWKWRPVTVRL